jgi:hypothetical protein
MLRRWVGIVAIPGTVALGTLGASEQPIVATIRAITASPDRYSNRAVRITGRFAGRAAGDDARVILEPLKSRWDFLLKWDDEAVWVSGLRPVGRDFDLDPRSSRDSRTGHWLQVTGTVRVDHRRRACAPREHCARFWIEATDLQRVAPPWGIALQLALRSVVPPPAVVFQDPIAEETNVPPTTPVRLQFSRPMAADTFSERVLISYALPALSTPPVPKFTAVYHEDTRGLEIRFAAPLAGSQVVEVDLLPGIRARDGRGLAPVTLRFTTAAAGT